MPFNVNADGLGSLVVMEEMHRIILQGCLTYHADRSWGDLEKYDEKKILDAFPNRAKMLYCLTHHSAHKMNTGWLVQYGAENDRGIATVEIVSYQSGGSRVAVEVVGNKRETVEEIINSIDAYLSKFKVKNEDNRVQVMFSAWGTDGTQTFTRKIACPSWKDVRWNYLKSAQIEHLMGLERPEDIGKLIFWHGLPGTGKTYAIRALLNEWRDKSQFTYILDPEVFFGEARYMVDVVMRSAEMIDDDDDYEDDYGGRTRRRIRTKTSLMVLIVEDGLQILLEESRRSQAGAMGRLLNLTEGLLGQGLRILVLVTSNEQIGKIDPAYLRAGRCLQSLEFPAFSMARAEEWCVLNGIAIPATGERTFGEDSIWKKEMTLSDLYAVKNGQRAKIEQIRDIVKVEGFTVGQ